jgi:dTDP-4-dehydrorhamnose 3,5-epimerase-like enzyme
MSMTSSPSLNATPDGSDAPVKWRFTPLAIPEVVFMETPRFGNARGWFSESFNRRVFAESGIEAEFA